MVEDKFALFCMRLIGAFVTLVILNLLALILVLIWVGIVALVRGG